MIELVSLKEVKLIFYFLLFLFVIELDVFLFVFVFMYWNIFLFNVCWLDGDVILFKRFKFDNFMYVLYDDVIFFYYIIKFLGNRNFKLLFMDNYL